MADNQNFKPLQLFSINPVFLEENGVVKIRCLVRQKYVVLLPEEWVRQHLLHYLAEIKGYPISRIAVEFPLKYGKTARRADIVVFGKTRKPEIIVECKAPTVSIKQNVMDQVAKYNTVLDSGIVVISNGTKHFVVAIKDGETAFLKDVPMYGE